MTTARARAFLPALLIALAAAPAARADLPKVPTDFEVRVVASFPKLLYPCQVATSPDGALFVAVDPMDQVGPYEANLGKIYLYREGQEPVVYAEGFRAIFGMAWHDGALYVSHMPYLSVIRDTDGDGKSDSRQDLFKDLGITNNKGLNDHIVSGIQFGIDNKLYISTGDKGVLKATGPDGKTAQVVGGGTLRCNPDGTNIEVISTGTRNHLEPNLDDRDNLFTYDNTDDGDGWWTRVTHHVDGAYFGYPYDYHAHPERFLNRIAEFGGGSPCGGVVYKEDAWPEKYRNRAIWSEWGKRKVSAFAFEASGASFKIKDVIEMAEPNGEELRPLDVALSYDGKTLYIADWGMGSWGSKTEKVGRVYAISYKGPAIATRPRGKDSDPIDDQIKQLDHPSWNERMRAQDALIKKGREALPVAVKGLADPKTDPVALRHLVWVVDGIAGGTPEGDLAILNALKSPVTDVRAQAARSLGERRGNSPEILDGVIPLLNDPEPTVKLQAIIALGRMNRSVAIPGLLAMLTDPDRYLSFSARQALRRIENWEYVGGSMKDAEPRLRAAILAAVELVYDRDAVRLLRQVLEDSKAPEAERAKALAEMAEVHRKAPEWDGKWWGTRPTQGKPPARTIAWEATAEILKTIEASVSDPSSPVRLAAVSAIRATNDRDGLPLLRERFGVEGEPSIRQEIAVALGNMGDKAALPILVAALRDPANPEGVRASALSGLELIGGKPAIEALVEALAGPGESLKEDTQIRMISALGRFKAREAIPVIEGRLAHKTPTVRVASVESLAKIGDLKAVAPKLRPLLKDGATDVRKATLGSLAALGDRESIPAILEAANDEPTRFEATLALAKMPDIRALQVYLRGSPTRARTSARRLPPRSSRSARRPSRSWNSSPTAENWPRPPSRTPEDLQSAPSPSTAGMSWARSRSTIARPSGPAPRSTSPPPLPGPTGPPSPGNRSPSKGKGALSTWPSSTKGRGTVRPSAPPSSTARSPDPPGWPWAPTTL